MARRKRTTGIDEVAAIVMGLANVADALFVRYTGRTLTELIKEPARPRELPAGERTAIAEAEPEMRLADAYAILGLKSDASLAEVKRNYRNLARAFHSDKGSVMNDEAMKLLNRAYEKISRGKQ